MLLFNCLIIIAEHLDIPKGLGLLRKILFAILLLF
jgi:hypothetical protein